MINEGKYNENSRFDVVGSHNNCSQHGGQAYVSSLTNGLYDHKITVYSKNNKERDMMIIEKLPYDFSICKVGDISGVHTEDEFCFIGKTDEEISVVCLSSSLPDDRTHTDSGWKGMRIQGELDFSLIGILAEISAVLAKAEIGIFVVSTYNTDYIFVKESSFDKAVAALTDSGYNVA